MGGDKEEEKERATSSTQICATIADEVLVHGLVKEENEAKSPFESELLYSSLYTLDLCSYQHSAL